MNAPFDVTGIVIRTPRLLLREWRESDLADLFAYASVEGVGEMAGWAHHADLDESRRILKMFMAEKKTFAIVHLATGRVIGSLGLEFLSKPFASISLAGRELGYVLSRDYWGQGLMPEAVKAVIAYLFDVLHFDFVTCGHFVRNDRSRRVIEKCGFTPISTPRDYVTAWGSHEQAIEYVLYNPAKEINL